MGKLLTCCAQPVDSLGDSPGKPGWIEPRQGPDGTKPGKRKACRALLLTAANARSERNVVVHVGQVGAATG
ncbi:hypothetical protein, partial [Achromobacter xylosoxidans]|uniref:hypothetical protein n=1 Tax=Alcaligenes xylosoxydans xylosoxydans TaxID=85698 RepID=UPI001955293F